MKVHAYVSKIEPVIEQYKIVPPKERILIGINSFVVMGATTEVIPADKPENTLVIYSVKA
jgi:hypothetical protein